MTLSCEALLWDMDGLLVDSEPLWFLVERDFAKRRGGDFTEEHARENIGKGIKNTVRFMHALFGFDVDVDRDVDELIGDFMARTSELSLKPGARELLEKARESKKLALASSSHKRLVMRTLDQFGLVPMFDAIVSGEDVKHPKPAPDLFLLAADLVGVHIERCVVLEDSIAGVTAGRRAGAKVIAVPEGPLENRPFEAFSDVIAVDLFEAADHLGMPTRSR
ncbi:MAG: HAD family phosphatase [Polyangiaceae bacterium]|nr:HAD family phosphatase [Polyangiaceae bacterium]